MVEHIWIGHKAEPSIAGIMHRKAVCLARKRFDRIQRNPPCGKEEMLPAMKGHALYGNAHVAGNASGVFLPGFA